MFSQQFLHTEAIARVIIGASLALRLVGENYSRDLFRLCKSALAMFANRPERHQVIIILLVRFLSRSIPRPSRLLVAIYLLCGAGAAAADALIDEIQVTATRRAARSADTPSAVSVITTDAIDANALLTDSLAFTPGVFLQQTTPGQGAAIIRGLKGSEVLHLVDGARLNNAIFRNAPTQYLALVPASSAQTIEVVRGSASALYGSDAIGGVVNVVSQKPEFNGSDFQTRGSFQLSANSAELARSAALTWEAGNEALGGLVSLDTQSFGDRRIGGGERLSPSDFSATGARLAFSGIASETTHWFADLHYKQQDSTPRVDELIAGFGETEAASDEFFFEPNRRSFLHLGLDQDAGVFSADWQLRLAWQAIDDDRRTRNRGSDERQLEQNRSDLFQLSALATNVFSNGSWVAGAEWFHDEVDSARQLIDLPSGSSIATAARFPDGAVLDQAALFGHSLWKLSDRHSVSAGLRWTRVSADTKDSPNSKLRNTNVSGELGWLIQISDAVQFTVNYGNSFRAPNIFDLGSSGVRPGNRFSIANADLSPEKAHQFDVGLRGTTGRARFSLTLFRVDFRDRIESVLTGDLTADGRDIVQNRNLAEAEIFGLEASAGFQFRDDLRLVAVLNYVRGTEANPEEEPADRIPPLNGRVALAWDYNESLDLGASIIFADDQSRLSARDIRDNRIDPFGTPGWASLTIDADYRISRHWQLGLAVENLLDKRYRQHGSGVDAVGINARISIRRDW